MCSPGLILKAANVFQSYSASLNGAIILIRGARGSLRRISSSMARLVDIPVAALKRSTISEESAESDTVARRIVFCF